MPLHQLDRFSDSLQHLADPFEDPVDPFEDPVDPFKDPVDPFADPANFPDSIPDCILQMLSNMFASPQEGHRQCKRLRRSGEVLQRCMKDPSVPCDIPRSQLSIRDLKRQDWDVKSTSTGLPPAQRENALALGYPDGKKDYRMTLLEKTVRMHDESCWHGRIAKGVIFIETIERISVDAAGPWMSELTGAVYTKRFPMETLRHVFVCNVVNDQTFPILRRLYATRRPGTWNNGQVAIWEESDRDFPTLLGTRIGKVVTYMVLGAFDRGSRRIARIATWHSLEGIHMRFDLE